MSASKQEYPKEDFAAYYALHVALQTMKERCHALQVHLVNVENENTYLKMENQKMIYTKLKINEQNGRSEVEMLRNAVTELTQQKSQLDEHISMVAYENRQLWQRLTQLTKEGQNVGDIQAAIKDITSSTTNTHQNLIRSKTFTQNSPNPMLRQKINVLSQAGSDENISLEEISLKVLNDFLEGKAEFEKKCGEIIPSTQVPSKPNLLGFGYLNEETIDAESQNDSKKCMEGMLEVKKELLRQQSDLKVALSNLRQRKVLEICATCRAHPEKPTTADKIIETEDIFTHRLDEHEMVTKSYDESTIEIDFNNEKRVADCIDKMCPMCGKVYKSGVKFDDFREHVESHFIDDSELDTSIERNYEIISHAVGNF